MDFAIGVHAPIILPVVKLKAGGISFWRLVAFAVQRTISRNWESTNNCQESAHIVAVAPGWRIIVAMETRCARCDAAMSCKPEGGCWCAELPHGPMPVVSAGEVEGCLCRSCLEKERYKDRVEGRRSPQET